MNPAELGVAVIGAGYWGPNLVRNFASNADCRVYWVCDLSPERARKAAGRYSTIETTTSLDEVLADPRVGAVAVATPAGTHHAVVTACLEAGRHVLVEKPLACSVAEGRSLVDTARRNGRVLMLDHTFCYTQAVRRLRDMSFSGELGRIQYIDSVRINLGLVQKDIDVLWDLAPHDLSILDVVLPSHNRPVSLAAQAADPIGSGQACVGYLTIGLAEGGIAHVHVNWLSPTKIRTMIVGGSSRTAVWNDLDPVQRLSVYDRGVDVQSGDDSRQHQLVSYRIGDMTAPALKEGEALQEVVCEFVSSIRDSRAPLTDGAAGVRVLELLEAARLSLRLGGVAVDLTGRRVDTPELSALSVQQPGFAARALARAG